MGRGVKVLIGIADSQAAGPKAESMASEKQATLNQGLAEPIVGHCQTNVNGPAKGAALRRSGRQLTPLGQGGRTVLFEDVAAVEVTVVVEVVVD